MEVVDRPAGLDQRRNSDRVGRGQRGDGLGAGGGEVDAVDSAMAASPAPSRASSAAPAPTNRSQLGPSPSRRASSRARSSWIASSGPPGTISGIATPRPEGIGQGGPVLRVAGPQACHALVEAARRREWAEGGARLIDLTELD